MPFTFAFEAARNLIIEGSISPGLIAKSYISAIAYFLVSWPIYYLTFKKARRTGMLAK